MLFPQILGRLMQERGVSARALAAALELSNATVSGWLKGTYHPRPEQFKSAADYFGITTDELSGQSPTDFTVQEDTPPLAAPPVQKLIARLDRLAAEVVEIRGELAELAADSRGGRGRTLVPVTLPSQTQQLSSATGKPILRPSPRAREA